MKQLVTIILLAVFVLTALTGCGTLYPRTIITGGDAAGSVNRDEMFDVRIDPIKQPPTPEPEADGGEWILEIIEGGD